MAPKTTPETQRKHISAMSDREVAEETLEHLRNVDAILTKAGPLLDTFSMGGLLAFRRAARANGVPS